MTIRRAIRYYLISIVVALVVAWCLAYYVDWRIGMLIATFVIADHARFTVKRILRN